MSNLHTPGPWTKAERLNGPWWHISSEHTVDGKRTIGGRQAIACVHGESKRGALAYAEMFEANARLIAASPELLSILKSALKTAELEKHVARPWHEEARATIARIEGTTNDNP
ncbi:hypothetical protein HNP33_004225 [Comamonas odontotermitis]|uniref:Uncharacterized protein n=1 Tax=Comamonas odontotermitis TaxID=379895 RepID=A0ABR6RLN6_9BURK|nr:hypothetical protein [Comamonas odontotermitis]MBB6580094.1 hypothetical protein [Comamonas odontotermitis]